MVVLAVPAETTEELKIRCCICCPWLNGQNVRPLVADTLLVLISFHQHHLKRAFQLNPSFGPILNSLLVAPLSSWSPEQEPLEMASTLPFLLSQ